ncbi:hypothetical protein QJQ45_006904 [Haematococcus lacustris]|nr:hypothetical protein QJQ45_006904 [Haematococcus lacustris]
MSDARDDTQWFQLLLRNKAIRNYLTSFRAKEWPEVLKLTTLYGIISLHKQHGGPLPAAQLRDAIAKGSMAITAEASLPGLQLQLDQLQGQLEEITDDIYAPSVVSGLTLGLLPDLKGARTGMREWSLKGPGTAKRAAWFCLVLGPQEILHQDKPSKARGSREGASQGPSLLQVSYNGQGPQGLSPTIHSEGLPGGQAPSAHFAASPLRQRASEELRFRSRSVEPGREGRSRHQPVKAPLPSAQWRAGDTARVWSPPGRKRSPGRAMSPAKEPAPDSAVYPAWWGDGSDQAKSQGPVPSKAAPLGRPPPRMACTVRPELVPLHVDDLVSSKYLDVASSGYGVAAPPRATSDTRQQAGPQQQQGTWADQGATLQHWLPAAGTDPLSSPWGDQRPQLTAGQSLESGWGLAAAQTLFAMHPSGAMVPVMLPQPTLAPPLQPAPQQQPQQPADENQRRGHAGAGDLGKGAQGRGGRKKLDLGIVESRIKQQVAADRAAARGKSQARQQALQQALGGGAPGPQVCGQGPAATPGQHFTTQGMEHRD